MILEIDLESKEDFHRQKAQEEQSREAGKPEALLNEIQSAETRMWIIARKEAKLKLTHSIVLNVSL